MSDNIIEKFDAVLEESEEQDVDDVESPNIYPYKKCSVCEDRKSCGNYNTDMRWFCEDCYEEYEEDNKDKYDGAAVFKKMVQDGDFKEFVHLDDETKRIEIIMGWRKYTHQVGDIIIRQHLVNGNLYCSKDTIARVNPKSYSTVSGTKLIRQSYYVIKESMTRHLHLSPVEIK